MPFVEIAHPHVDCAGAGNARSLASRLWHAQSPPEAELAALARAAALRLNGPVGRVESGGTFESADIQRAVRRALLDSLADFMKPRMEWYGCRGAFFHNDAHFDDVLFGVWSLAGPPRELVFPRIKRRLSAGIGSIVVFDPYEPHGVLDAGATTYRAADYEASEPNLFLGFEVALSAQVREAFGVESASWRGPTLSSRVAINPETGELATSVV